jgi:hypothetical protein
LLSLFGMRAWCVVILGAACGSSPASPDARTAGGDARPPDGAIDAACGPGVERDGPYTRFTVANDDIGTAGFIDPSVEYPSGAAAGLMTYTTVPDPGHDEIAIAASIDAGASWNFQALVTTATPATIDCGSTTCTGTMIDESSSLVLDPTDDSSRRLKVFAHEYLFDTQRELLFGYIAMYTAATPTGPWAETKLFGWTSSSSVSTTGVAYNISTDPRLPEMHDCVIVGEPGGYVRANGTLELVLGCNTATTADIRLLRSTDHGVTWTFVSKLLTPDDGVALGGAHREITGGDLFFAAGKLHLVATPDGDVTYPGGTTGDGYRGCVVVPIADIDAGTVERCNGAPVIETAYRGQPGQFVGACTAAEGASAAGMLIPVPQFTQTLVFQVFAAELPLP